MEIFLSVLVNVTVKFSSKKTFIKLKGKKLILRQSLKAS